MSIVLLATTVATCAPAEVTPRTTEIARLHSLGGERFSIRHTDHFLIASDSDERVVNSLTERLEATYQAVVRFADNMKLPIHPPPDPLPVLLFDHYSDYVRYAHTLEFNDLSAPGFYHHRSNTAAFCNVLDFPQLRDISQRIEQAETQPNPLVAAERITDWKSQRDALVETFNRLVIHHEAAHQVQFNTGVLSRDAENPGWLAEGLACQFEVSLREGVNQLRLADFREALGAAPDAVNAAASALSAAQSDKRFLSLTDLVADDEFNVADDSKRTFRYAQAWALVDYLNRTHGDAFAAYLRRIAARMPNEPTDRQYLITEFQSVFGLLDQEFERLWIESVLRLPFDPRQRGR